MTKKRKKNFFNKIFIFCSLVLLFSLIAIFFLNWYIEHQTAHYIYTHLSQLPSSQTVLILGASVYRNKTMSEVLKDRVDTAIAVYQSGKAQKILVSGDNREKNYNETATINRYLLEKGINPNDIFLDYAGFDTYDSLYRARDIFQVKSLIISTQAFHLPRALFIAHHLGIKAYGITADRKTYANIEFSIGREVLARLKACFDVFFHSLPAYLGEPMPIP